MGRIVSVILFAFFVIFSTGCIRYVEPIEPTSVSKPTPEPEVISVPPMPTDDMPENLPVERVEDDVQEPAEVDEIFGETDVQPPGLPS